MLDFVPGSPISIAGASQIELELLYSKHQLHDVIGEEFKSQGFPEALEEVGIPVHFGIVLLTQMALFKRATLPTMVGVLRSHFKEEPCPAQACADMIRKACEEDVIDWDPKAQQLVVIYEINQELQERLDQFQYPLPMIEEPRPVTDNRHTGYRTIVGSAILKKGNHHEDDICLDHLNRVNSQKLALNQNTVTLVRNQWKNLDVPKKGESLTEFRDRRKAFIKYNRSSKDILDALIIQGNQFWLTHKYDKRGRTYCQGYHVTYQGNDWNKACVEFAEAETLNKE